MSPKIQNKINSYPYNASEIDDLTSQPKLCRANGHSPLLWSTEVKNHCKLSITFPYSLFPIPYSLIMILTDIQSYLQKCGKISLAELALHFQMDTDAIRPLLKRLINKGRIRLMKGEKCASCSHCSSEMIEFYEWVELSQSQ